MNPTPNLPTEIWDSIFDYKNAMETKDKHNALTKDLIVEVNKWASRPFRSHFTNDVWWWMSEDGEKVVRPEIYQDEETGEYEEDFTYHHPRLLHKEKMWEVLGYIKYDMVEGAQDGEYVAGEE